jgi:hypothetical protein
MPKVKISHAVDQLADDLYRCDIDPRKLKDVCRLVLLMAPAPLRPIEIASVIDQASRRWGYVRFLPKMVRRILTLLIDRREARLIHEGSYRAYERTDRLKLVFDKKFPRFSKRLCFIGARWRPVSELAIATRNGDKSRVSPARPVADQFIHDLVTAGYMIQADPTCELLN